MTARKGISLLLSLALVFSAVLAVLPAPALAAESASGISLDAGVIAKNDTVWFGSYSNSSYNHFGPVQWRVLSPSTDATLPVSDTGDVLLISNRLLQDSDVYFKQDGSSNQWADSDAQAWCTNLYNDWPKKEKAAVKATSVTETNDKTSAGRTYYYRGGYFNDYYSAASLNAEHFFFLSAEEADKYFNNDADRQGYSEYFRCSWWWWLRSPLTDDPYFSGDVDADGWVRIIDVDDDHGARPAFNLNLPSVLFVSAAEGGKSIAAESGESSGAEGAGVYKIPSGSQTEWKLTLKDSSRSGFASSAPSVSGTPGGKISIPYSGAKTGTNEYVSILICDSTGAAQYYGSYKISAASGTADFVLPSDLATGNYTVKLFNEQRNGNHESDYASDFISIPLKVGKAVSYQVTFKVENGYWNTGDHDSTDKTVTLTGVEGDTLTLASGDIPAAGNKPADTYKPGSWSPSAPSASTSITGNTTYTYTYAKKNSISATVVFKVENGGWNDDSLTGDQTVTLTGLEDDTLKLTDAQIPGVGSKPNDTYKPGSWDTTPSTSTTFANGSITTYTYTYAKKNSISQTVTFKVVNGSWDNGNTADITVTLTGLEGDTLKLAANQIPAVGGKPATNYKAGGWDNAPNTTTAISQNTTYTYTYAAKTPISQTVTFKVVNGSWDDGTATDKTVSLSGYEGDTLKLAANQIPAVGGKPNDTFKVGEWDIEPSTEAEITGNPTYTYTYAVKTGISQTVTFKVVNGSWNDGTATDKTVTLNGLEGDTLKLAANQIPAVGNKPADTYKAGAWDVEPSAEAEITTATTYTYTYAAKDSISQTVTFKVVNGSWDDGTTADKIVTLNGLEGDTLKLAANQIPAVGTKPADTFKAGEWDIEPSTEAEITTATTYTYTYAAKGTISYTVTLKVVHGTWNDGTREDKTFVLTGSEGDELRLNLSDLPGVTKPDKGYDFATGAWSPYDPPTIYNGVASGDPITQDMTFTFTYGEQTTQIIMVTLRVVHGEWGDELGGREDRTIFLEGPIGEELRLQFDQIPDVNKPDAGYSALTGSWDKEPSFTLDGENYGDPITEDTVYTYTYGEIPMATIINAPTANDLTYSGQTQELVTAGEAEGGEMQYALGADAVNAPTSGWSTEVPAGREAKTYYVWYRAVGDKNHADTDARCVTVTISGISYSVVSGSGQVWRRDSNESLSFTVKRSLEDELTFGRFDHGEVDEAALTSAQAETEQGSLILRLKPAYLETLSLGSHTIKFIFSDGTAEATFTVKAVAGSFEDVAVPSDTFTFKKVWQGDSEKSIDFTLYKIDGSVYHHGFDKKIVSKTEWRYNAWFSAPAACYVIEEPVEGYITRYENVGVYAGITDRCCDGGTIINKKIPKTGDSAPLALWVGMILLGTAGIGTALVLGKRRKANK